MKWHKFSEEDLPPVKGQYIVAYHPCCWDNVHTNELCAGVDTYRGFGKAAKEDPRKAWVHNKYKLVTHWTEFPELPKEK